MNTDIQTAPRAMQGATLAKIQALKPLLTGLVIALPCAVTSFSLMQTRMAWPYAPLVMIGVLALMVADFLTLIAIEPYRGRIGDLTIPASLLFIGVTLGFMVTETLNRFVANYSFSWLTPVTIVALALIYGGVLRERFLLLKLFLALNGLVLTLLWCLGDADKVALPF